MSKAHIPPVVAIRDCYTLRENRALTRILKTGVPEPSLPKSGSPTIQNNIACFKKIGVPAPNMGVQNCKSSVSESSGKDKIVKDFIILNQVVSEKTLMKNVHMCHIRMTEGKFEKRRQNED